MAFPNSKNLPDELAKIALSRAQSLRLDAARYIAVCQAGSLPVHDVIVAFCAQHLAPVKVEFAAFAAVPGFFDELVRQKPNVFASAVAAQTAFTAAQAAIDTMILFIEANAPVDAQRRVLGLTLSADGSGTVTQRTITTQASLAAFQTQLEAFRDAFEA